MYRFLKPLSKTFFCFVIVSLFFNISLFAQEESTIVDHLEEYAAAPREVVYAHLNKSIYIEGEMLGFTAYVFDKFTKERSEMTTNLYCTISDKDGKIIKKQMVFVKDGIVSNVFNIDEAFTDGTYTFKAYTNWMFNFKEQNHFQQTFSVLDADNENEIKISKDNTMDVQLLGEGGHLLYGTLNSAGIIVKNKSGYGLPKAKGKIIDENDTVITEFTLNNFGIAKVLFTPESGKRYYTVITHNQIDTKKEIKDIKSSGFVMALTNIRENLVLSFKTNENSLNNIKNKSFNVALHNGDELKLIPLKFNTTEERMILPKTELFNGINIFTVFDENNQPILERLFFSPTSTEENLKLDYVSTTKENDSLLVTLKLNNTTPETFQNISVSVLPSETNSYTHQHNISSQLYLQPYVRGAIENAGYYFKNTNRKTQYELDLLLITQGWSSYDWTTIFNFEDNFNFPFERGIDVVTTVNNKKTQGTYLVYPLKNNSTQVFELKGNENVFTQKRVIPTEGEKFRVGQIKANSKQGKPGVYPQFYPSVFPTFQSSYDYLNSSGAEFSEDIKTPTAEDSWDKRIEKLDEVVVAVNRKQERLEALTRKANGESVREITDSEKIRGTTLAQIINELGFFAQYDFVNAQFTIINPRVQRGPSVPVLFLDDALITDPNILRDIPVETIEFIESSRLSSSRYGFRGFAGFIKIYTGTSFYYRNDGAEKTTSVFDFPLTFNSPKTFYTPTYQFYDTKFFKAYGTIGWYPNLKTDPNGIVSFKILDTKANTVNLYIEGVVNDNDLISEIKTINPNTGD
ncbi:hypothetical protein [Winogradskyella immobilis]|uniref:TonB-dependent receptor plug domain-containing protein n=1 Tax=Winogradskyella immobilis TaxID=2816852 RepID=A0ABS8EQD7_9FLAO|nr:hypothetical protein [Winogradskyella immobilis]MCC1485454.1 hypothetical protein [Winogradskyella immobilis]MCG0017546.1 hypothetical protein [Winogradskyella immobilis]